MKRRLDLPRRALSLLLAGAAALSLLLPAARAEETTVSLRTAEDLVTLAQRCTLDTWSQGKTVRLEADLDLSGTDFTAIPTFGGTFEGNGHTISGLSLSGESTVGLFRSLQEGAVVQNLTVRGDLTATGSQSVVGGIAGENNGTISGCTFDGTVSGRHQAGGIAGRNESGGSLYRCTARGTVSGERATGGIVGENNGSVTGCVNLASVNTAAYTPDRSLEESLGLPEPNELSGLSTETTELLDTTTDTGGVAGYSTGVLRSCRNEGAVGYPHIGYNVGGVAGRSSGYIDGCSNTGSVQGRKDVGGIAGQLAPNILLIFSESSAQELEGALDQLDTLLNQALDHAQASGSTLSGRLEALSSYTDAAADSAGDLADSTLDWAGDSLEQVNDIGSALADTLDRLDAVTGRGEDILNQAARGLDQLSGGLDDLSAGLELGEAGADGLQTALDTLNEATGQGQEALDQIHQAAGQLSQALVVRDAAKLSQASDLLDQGLTQLASSLRRVHQALTDLHALLDQGFPPEDGSAQTLLAALEQLAGGFRDAAGAVDSLNLGVLLTAQSTDVDLAKLDQGLDGLLDAAGALSTAAGTLSTSLGDLKSAAGSFGGLSAGLSDGSSGFARAMDTFAQAARDLGDAADDLHDIFADLADRPAVEFPVVSPDYRTLGERIQGAVTGMGQEMDGLRTDLQSAGDDLAEDLRAVEAQFRQVSDLLLRALADPDTPSADDLWDDVSQEAIDQVTLGKARDCSNRGAVQGDLNVGGVAGSMAVEYDLDPEDDISRVGTESLNFHYETRAILQTCTNRGPVTAKKDAAGGVVGRMDLGYILACENYGAVESTAGDYVGGVAGTARSVLRGCWSKCALTGGKYVGGVAGYATELYDCTALVLLSSGGSWTGAIAGDWDRTGALSGNRFVPLEGQAGVDGVSYAGKAQPVSFSELDQTAMPERFRQFILTYRTEDQVVEQVTCAYGDPLSAHPAPEVPEQEGCTGTWELPDCDTVDFDYVITARYTPYNTTLASDAQRETGRPVFLMEGDFSTEARLRACADARTDDGEVWTVTLEGGDSGEHVVRFRPPEDCGSFTLTLADAAGKKLPLSWDWDGSCCVFTAPSGSFTLTLTAGRGLSPLLWLLLLPAAALVLLVLVRRRRKQHAPQ